MAVAFHSANSLTGKARDPSTFDAVQADLQKIITTHARNTKTPVNEILRQIIAQANSLSPEGTIGASLIGRNIREAESFKIVFAQLARQKRSYAPGYFYRAMERLGIEPQKLAPDIKWTFPRLEEYNVTIRNVLEPLTPTQPIAINKEVLPQEDELTRLRKKVALLTKENAALRAELSREKTENENLLELLTCQGKR